jgi:hypothetical protein
MEVAWLVPWKRLQLQAQRLLEMYLELDLAMGLVDWWVPPTLELSTLRHLAAVGQLQGSSM